MASTRDDGQSWTPFTVAYDDDANPDLRVNVRVPTRLVTGKRVWLHGGAPKPGQTYTALVSDDYGASFRTPPVLVVDPARNQGSCERGRWRPPPAEPAPPPLRHREVDGLTGMQDRHADCGCTRRRVRHVEAHLDRFLATARERHGRELPRYVGRELRAYLQCGRLEYGFARARCEECGRERAVAFSCKKRGVCPSCNARRMASTAALIESPVDTESFFIYPLRIYPCRILRVRAAPTPRTCCR